MTLFLSLLPLYLLGNLHCAGMCGPLVLLLGKHRYRALYFIGRLLSFSLVAMLSAELGAILTLLFQSYHIPALSSLLLGGGMIFLGVLTFFHLNYPGQKWLAKRTATLSNRLGKWMVQEHPSATFLFGVCTVLLPCGQTLVVFSACALSGDPLVGLLNGFLFALLTSPALILAMGASTFLKREAHKLMGSVIVVVGLLAFCRGLADFNVISHYIINPQASSHYHIVLF